MPTINLKSDDDTIIEIHHDDSNTVLVDRCDFVSRLGSVKRTGEGYLRGDAAVARVGILKYLLPNGTTRSELVPPETLFKRDSMDTLKLQPITDRHPPEILLDKTTVKRRRVGTTGENIKTDEGFLTTSIVITDADAIDSVESGRQQLSPGYKATIVLQSGMYKGERYDAVQIDRQYNHVAICDRARGGSDLRLNLDSIDIEHLDGFEINEDAELTTKKRQALPDSAFCLVIGTGENKIRKFPANDAAHVRNALARLPQSNLSPSQKSKVKSCLAGKAEKFGVKVGQDSLHIDEVYPESLYNISTDEMEIINSRKEHHMPQFRIDGIDYEAAQEVINQVTKLQSKVDELEVNLKEVGTSQTELQAKHDELKEKNDELGKRDIAKEVNDGVAARLSLMNVATTVMDEKELKEMKTDEMSDIDIKKAVILKRSPNAKMDDKDETYVNARFDAVVDGIDFDPDAAARNRQKSGQRQDSDGTDSVEKARKDSEEKITNSYQNLPEQYTK